MSSRYAVPAVTTETESPVVVPIHPHADAAFTGDSGNNTQTGTTGNDVFHYGQGGNDSLSGLDGDDKFYFRGTFDYQEQVDGGPGSDTLYLDGDYHTGGATEWSPTTLTNVEEIILTGGNSYTLFLNNGTVAAGQTLLIDSTGLASDEEFFLDADFELDGSFQVIGGPGMDSAILGGGTDLFLGNLGNDNVFFDENMTAADRVDGGAGFDSVFMSLPTSQGLALTPTTLVSVERLDAHSTPGAGLVQLTLDTDEATVAAGKTLVFTCSEASGSTFQLAFHGTAETDGHFDVTAGTGDDAVIGGALSDVMHFETGGRDGGYGSAGNDIMYAGASLRPDDSFQGNDGFDVLDLNGDYSAGVSFQPATIQDTEKIVVHAGNDYLLGFDPGNVAAGATLRVDGTDLGADDTLTIYGAAVTAGRLVIDGGDGDDFLIGGTRNDQLNGHGGADVLSSTDGADTLNGGAGVDNLYGSKGADTIIGGTQGDNIRGLVVSDSTGTAHDTIGGFNADADHFVLNVHVNAIDATVSSGALDSGSFNAGLAAAVGAGQLAKHHAVLFTPTSGNLDGHTILVVESNGKAGYQAGKDYVFDLSGAVNLVHLDTTDFTYAP